MTHIITVTADLPAWREAQVRLEEARRLLESVMDAAPVTIQVVDSDMRIRWANRAYREFFGWTETSPIDLYLTETVPNPDWLASTLAFNNELLSGVRDFVQTEQYDPGDGVRPERHLLVTKAPIYSSSGSRDQILTIGVDITALKRAQAEAETANRLIEGILLNVPLSIQVKDANLRYRWVNKAFCDLFNVASNEILGKSVDDLNAPVGPTKQTTQLDRQVLTTKETVRFTERVVINGTRHQMMVVKAPMLDADGRTTHVITIAADVSELEHLRAEADAARRRLQQVLDAVPVTIALKDRDRRYLWVNREFERVNGHASAMNAVGLRVEDLLPARDLAEAVRQADEAVLQTGIETEAMPQRLPAGSGMIREHMVRRLAVRDGEGQIEGILVVGIDVTDLVRATNELRLVNALLEQRAAERALELAKVNELVSTVLQSAPVPIITLRPDGRIISWNPAAEKVSGYTAEEAFRFSGQDLLPAGQNEFTRMAEMVMRGESFSNLEVTQRHKDGRLLELIICGAPLRGPDGTIEGGVGICLDVTEQRATARQLQQAQKMEAIGQLTGGVAHDFNNLLAVVIGSLDLLATSIPPDGHGQTLLRQAIEAAERGAGLTARLLAFARRQTLRPTATDVNVLLRNMTPLLQRATDEAITLRQIRPSDLWLALVDPSQLESAILNLTVNARDAMQSGGVLTIELRNAIVDRDEAMQVPDAAAGDYVCVMVSDTGIGIPHDIQAKVFEPFFTTKDVGRGSGLGLSMVLGFVKQSGGHVRLESEPNEGTRISLYLPRATTAPQTQSEAQSVDKGNGETVLVVEDNASLRRVTAAIISTLGYQVVAVEDASVALNELAQRPDIALLLSDIVLPGGMNGFELARIAKKRRPNLPVVFMSGYAEPDTPPAGDMDGKVDILAKPFRRGELAERLGTALGKRAQA